MGWFLCTDYPLPEGWKKSLPKPGHAWVLKALFKWSTTPERKPELDTSKVTKLWWYPPQPALRVNQPPVVNKYFRQHLLVWMQRKLWRFKLNCPHMDWNKHPLTSAGLYPHVGQVLYLDGYFSLVTKYLECSKCKRNVISWSQAILDQLDVGHRRQFPIIITYNYACDMKVVRFLRQRNSANTLTQFTHNWMSNIMRSGSSALPTIWQIVSLLWRQVNNDLFSPQSLMIHSPAILFPNKNGGSRQEKNTWCSSDYDVNLKPPGNIL